MLKKININANVKVVLTEEGIKKLKRQYAYRVIDNGVVHMQLWEVLEIFGSDYRMGNNKLPFGTTIYINDDEVKPLDENDRIIKLNELDG